MAVHDKIKVSIHVTDVFHIASNFIALIMSPGGRHSGYFNACHTIIENSFSSFECDLAFWERRFPNRLGEPDYLKVKVGKFE